MIITIINTVVTVVLVAVGHAYGLYKADKVWRHRVGIVKVIKNDKKRAKLRERGGLTVTLTNEMVELLKKYFEEYRRKLEKICHDKGCELPQKAFIATFNDDAKRFVASTDLTMAAWPAEHNNVPSNIYSVELFSIDDIDYYRIENMQTGELVIR